MNFDKTFEEFKVRMRVLRLKMYEISFLQNLNF